MRRAPKLGQHFLKHRWAAAKLAHAVGVREGEAILEVGPGKGILTSQLLKFGPVIAVEKDPALVSALRDAFQNDIATKRLTLVEDDIRNFNPAGYTLLARGYVLAANIPYYITGEIIRHFLAAEVQPRAMALLMQKEVAQRIVNGKESVLSLSVKAYGTPRIVAKVPRSHFSPPPSVDSAILVVDDISRRFFDTVSEAVFFKVVRAGFASKRKKISNNLSAAFGKKAAVRALERCGVAPNERAENVPLERWKCVAAMLG